MEKLNQVKFLLGIVVPLLTLVFAIINTFTEKKKEVSKIKNKRKIVVKEYTIWAKISLIGLLITAIISLLNFYIDQDLNKIRNRIIEKKEKEGVTRIMFLKSKAEKIYNQSLTSNLLLQKNLKESNLITTQLQNQLNILNQSSNLLNTQYILQKDLINKNNELLTPLFPLDVVIETGIVDEYLNSEIREKLKKIAKNLGGDFSLNNKTRLNSEFDEILRKQIFEKLNMDTHMLFFKDRNITDTINIETPNYLGEIDLNDSEEIDITINYFDLLNDGEILYTFKDIKSKNKINSVEQIKNGLLILLARNKYQEAEFGFKYNHIQLIKLRTGIDKHREYYIYPNSKMIKKYLPYSVVDSNSPYADGMDKILINVPVYYIPLNIK